MTVRWFKDHLSSVLNQAKRGEVQLVGSEAGEQTIIISLKDFAMMFQGAARSLSFGDVLGFVGLKPVEHTTEFDERRRNREALCWMMMGAPASNSQQCTC
jgi:hypothetical protein